MENRTERRGFIWLSLVLVVVLIVLLLVPHKSKRIELNEQEKEAVAKLEQEEESTNKIGNRRYHNKLKKHQRRENYSKESEKISLSPPDFKRKEVERKELMIEINTADTLDLQELYGIGSYFSRAIVKYRSMLGGYVRKEQLREVYGMTEDRYQAILPYIMINQSEVKKIKINTASVAELRRHPYIDSYQARAIVRFRNNGGRFTSEIDLMKVSLLDKETIEKIAPYIDYTDDTIHSEPDGSDAQSNG